MLYFKKGSAKELTYTSLVQTFSGMVRQMFTHSNKAPITGWTETPSLAPHTKIRLTPTSMGEKGHLQEAPIHSMSEGPLIRVWMSPKQQQHWKASPQHT